MGSEKGRANERPVHAVRIAPYWIGRYEVTQQQWKGVMDSNPSRARRCPRCPVDSVSWEEGQVFLQKASALSGVELRFPTEAEWEFAAGGGKARQRWPGTNTPEEAGEFSWYSGNFSGKTKISGSKLPNLFGLYDMGGNVAEWCADWYGEDYYRASPSENPAGPLGGKKRVVRGGSWLSGPLETRVSWRTGRDPATRSPAVGLRVAAEDREKK
jgi:formylglycine-generating enzyme required for sulfatase activity